MPRPGSPRRRGFCVVNPHDPVVNLMPAQSTFQFHAIPADLLPEAGRYLIQAAAWFQGWLYLGITCYPADPYRSGATLLLRHRLRESGWEPVYTATVESRWIARDGQYRQFPLELGWRALSVLPGTAQPTPALYAIRLGLRAPAILHSQDGVRFEELPKPATGGGHDPFVSLRGFSGKVFAIPASAAHDSGRGGAVAYVTDDPRSQPWHPACAPGFGDAENRTVDGLQVANGQLYAAVGNPFGFQLWKTSAHGEPPFEWEQVLNEGAQRYTLDPHVETIAVFKDALYLGVRAPRPDPEPEFATAGAEIIRVLPNGRWELVMGTPRFSPIGLQVPLSAHGPGFGDAGYGRVSRLAATPDALYAVLGRHESPSSADPASAAGSGSRLWKSRDGENWQAITQGDFAPPAATSLRVLQPTPHGLVAAGDWDLALDPAARPGIWLERK